ncbi:MAG: S-methyl-5-thioribose-1-phosphate isomerase [Armatimonadota bacterium]
MTLQTTITPIRWADDHLDILDQRVLPGKKRYLACATIDDVAEAICTLAVRGAPLIGITAAYAMALAARLVPDRAALMQVAAALAATRPTAVNLFWALDRCRGLLEWLPADLPMTGVGVALLEEARIIHAEDAAACEAMALAGAELIPAGARVLTHCNAGALATGGIGTALGVIRAAHAQGKIAHVWVDETRPLLQGARLTAWELRHDGIPYRLICDNMAASLMAAGQVDLVVVGADRITRSGDFANKIGTYSLAVLAQAHHLPFYVAAPWSTIDLSLLSGEQIPVEMRAGEEVCRYGGQPTAPVGTTAWNPAFDVTPGTLVRAVITERGVFTPPLA